jgi:type III pantothenate kinase|tara:strand:- start:18 stop:743 length:726 start_codon:yes stop_codon:yes gene_type:complete
VTDLLVDCGNTRLKWRLQKHGVVQSSGAMSVNDVNLAQLQASLPNTVSALYWASVAGDELGLCIAAWAQQNNTPCQQITTQDHFHNLSNGYQHPQQLGVDRWLAMVAARQHTRKAVCVVDFGSAITFDYVNPEGQHEGSYIMPGARLMSQALTRDTAHIKVAYNAFENVQPGTGTVQAVLAGCYQMAHHGASGLIHAAQIRGYQILLCGGDGLALANELDLPYIEELVLDGLAQVAGLHKQ